MRTATARRSRLVSRPPLHAAARFQLIDQIGDVEETPTCSVADQRTGNRDGQMALSGSRATDKDCTIIEQYPPDGLLFDHRRKSRRRLVG